LGAFVTAVRPGDPNAWLLLFLMIAFTESASPSHGLTSGVWKSSWSGLWPLFMMLFGAWFPDRSDLDRRWPWVKYAIVIPSAAVVLFFFTVNRIWERDINAALVFR